MFKSTTRVKATPVKSTQKLVAEIVKQNTFILQMNANLLERLMTPVFVMEPNKYNEEGA